MIEVVDPNTRIWKPNKVQEEFLKLPDSIFEAMFGGAAGGGKSEIILILPVVRQFIQNARFKGIIFRRTFPQLEESLIPRSAEFYKPFGGEFNQQTKTWRFPSGAWIKLSHMLRVEDARQHDTAEFNYVGFDELTGFDEFQYLFLTSRVRSNSPNLPAIVRAATNPGNVGHSWVKKRFVAPSPGGRVLIHDTVTKSKRIFIPAKLTDNPHLMAADPDYINRLRILPIAEQKAKLDGDWDSFSGQSFDEFREFRYPDEPENALHVIEPFAIPDWWPRIIGADWGFTAQTWVGWAALAPNGRVYIYREYVCKFKRISDWGADVQRISQGENIVSFTLDPSAWQDRGDPKNIAIQVEEAVGFRPTQANNERVSGRMLYHEFLRWKPRPPRIVPASGFDRETAERILRLNGVKAYEEYYNLFLPEKPEENLPKLQIFETCPVLIHTIKSLVNDEKRPNDVAPFDGDDAYDGSRYLLKAVEFYQGNLDAERIKREVVGKAIEELSRTQDQTRFYRRMEAIEKGKRKEPIRLYHRARSPLM